MGTVIEQRHLVALLRLWIEQYFWEFTITGEVKLIVKHNITQNSLDIFNTIQDNTMQRNAMPYNTIQHSSAVQYNTIQNVLFSRKVSEHE